MTKNPDRAGLPRFVRRKLRHAVTCGHFASGFARVHCPTCARPPRALLL